VSAPCRAGFKLLVTTSEECKVIRDNLWRCVETYRAREFANRPQTSCRPRTGTDVLLETSGEVLQLFDRLRAEHPHDARLTEYLGVNYDTCHFAVEFEEPQNAIAALQQHGIKTEQNPLELGLEVAAFGGRATGIGSL